MAIRHDRCTERMGLSLLPAAALFTTIHAHAKVPVVDRDCGINDREFAEACVKALLAHMS